MTSRRELFKRIAGQKNQQAVCHVGLWLFLIPANKYAAGGAYNMPNELYFENSYSIAQTIHGCLQFNGLLKNFSASPNSFLGVFFLH